MQFFFLRLTTQAIVTASTCVEHVVTGLYYRVTHTCYLDAEKRAPSVIAKASRPRKSSKGRYSIQGFVFYNENAWVAKLSLPAVLSVCAQPGYTLFTYTQHLHSAKHRALQPLLLAFTLQGEHGACLGSL